MGLLKALSRYNFSHVKSDLLSLKQEKKIDNNNNVEQPHGNINTAPASYRFVNGI